MSAAPQVTADDDWERFSRLPAAIAHPAHVAALFDGAIGEDVAARLALHPRFAARLSALLARRLALPDADAPADAGDRALALTPADRLLAIARQAGAVRWAGAVAQEVRAERVAALKQAIGEDAYTAALAHRRDAVEAEAPAEPEALAAAIEQDGLACLSAWLATQSDGVAARVRLRLPKNVELPALDEALREAGPRILRRLAA